MDGLPPSIASGTEVLGVSLGHISGGPCGRVSFSFVELHPGVCKAPFPLVQSRKRGSWEGSRVEAEPGAMQEPAQV